MHRVFSRCRIEQPRIQPDSAQLSPTTKTPRYWL
jgi:hypothetical protein